MHRHTQTYIDTEKCMSPIVVRLLTRFGSENQFTLYVTLSDPAFSAFPEIGEVPIADRRSQDPNADAYL